MNRANSRTSRRTFLMQQVAAPAVVAVVLVMSGFAHAGEYGNKTKLSATGDCTFNSRLNLKVWVVRKAEQRSEGIGQTPSAKPVVIPKCVSWFVEPTHRLCMPELAKEAASKGLPGL